MLQCVELYRPKHTAVMFNFDITFPWRFKAQPMIARQLAWLGGCCQPENQNKLEERLHTTQCQRHIVPTDEWIYFSATPHTFFTSTSVLFHRKLLGNFTRELNIIIISTSSSRSMRCVWRLSSWMFWVLIRHVQVHTRDLHRFQTHHTQSSALTKILTSLRKSHKTWFQNYHRVLCNFDLVHTAG